VILRSEAVAAGGVENARRVKVKLAGMRKLLVEVTGMRCVQVLGKSGFIENEASKRP